MNPVSYRHSAPLYSPTRLYLFAALLLTLNVLTAHGQQPSLVRADSAITPTTVISSDAYRATYTPIVTVALGTLAKKNAVTKLAKMRALAQGADEDLTLIKPQSHCGIFDDVNLGFLDKSSGVPASAQITMQFAPSQAGATVWVQPLDGGTIITQDTESGAVSSPAGLAFLLDATGQSNFSYQASGQPGRFQVLIRCGNIYSILPLVVVDPYQDN